MCKGRSSYRMLRLKQFSCSIIKGIACFPENFLLICCDVKAFKKLHQIVSTGKYRIQLITENNP